MRVLAILSILTLISCSSPELITSTFDSEFGQLDILSIEHKKNREVVLLIMDDDTVSPKEQIQAIDKIYQGKKNIHALPKMDYKDILRKNNTDSPKLRLDNLVDAYFYLIQQNKITPDSKVTVLGIGEGSILAPHYCLNIRADNLVLINPYYTSMGENFVLNMTEKSNNSVKIEEQLRFNSDADWLQFIENAQNKNLPDKVVGSRSMRFYSEYWNVNPSEYLKNVQVPIQYVIFEDYMYTSIYNKKKLIEHAKQPNVDVIELKGDMFTKFSIEALKKEPIK